MLYRACPEEALHCPQRLMNAHVTLRGEGIVLGTRGNERIETADFATQSIYRPSYARFAAFDNRYQFPQLAHGITYPVRRIERALQLPERFGNRSRS